jgi:hypothetical protein
MSEIKVVEHAAFVIKMREGTTYSTYKIQVSFITGVPYLTFSWPTGKITGEIKVPMRDVAGIYCAFSGTEDDKWRAVSQAFEEGILP